MKTLLRLGLGSALCFVLTSCVVDSENSLSSPDTAHADPRLVGVWSNETDPDKNTFHFTITNGSWMHVVITSNQTDTSNRPSMIDHKPEEYDLFPTVIGNNSFLNVQLIGKDDQGHPTKTYVFIRYTISPDHTLHMWMMSQDAAAAAVRTGKLKGLVKQNDNTLADPPRPDIDVTLQDTGANIVKFIQNSNVDDLFNSKMNELHRVN